MNPEEGKTLIMPTCAVVMATYNGAAYVEQQLESLTTQSYLPDRVIIRDDQSSDQTPEIIADFIDRRKLQKWDFKVNIKNKGYSQNFIEAALNVNEEDVIFFCDQDDIWRFDKIESALRVFALHDEALAVACDSTIIDEMGTKSETLQTLSQKQHAAIKKVSFEKQVASMVSSGLTLAVRSEFFRQVESIITKNKLTYDSPIGLLAAAYGGFYRIGESQVLHRVHPDNTSAPVYTIKGRLKSKRHHIEGRKLQLDTLIACSNEISKIIDRGTYIELTKEITARKKSLDALEKHKVGPLITSVARKSSMKNLKVELLNLAIGLFGK